MHAKITITTSLPRAALEPLLADLTAGSPFRVRNLDHLGGGLWAFALQPLRPGLAIGFAKVAEMLVLLAREFPVEAVEHVAVGAAAPASCGGMASVTPSDRRPTTSRAS